MLGINQFNPGIYLSSTQPTYLDYASSPVLRVFFTWCEWGATMASKNTLGYRSKSWKKSSDLFIQMSCCAQLMHRTPYAVYSSGAWASMNHVFVVPVELDGLCMREGAGDSDGAISSKYAFVVDWSNRKSQQSFIIWAWYENPGWNRQGIIVQHM